MAQELSVKIGITPKENNQSSYEMLDLVAKDGRSYLSLKNNNQAPVTDVVSWMKMTENAYDVAVRNGFVGTEEEWLETVGESDKEEVDIRLKSLSVSSSGAVIVQPDENVNTFKLDIVSDVVISFNLQPMIQKIGNASCRLIIDMYTAREIVFTNPVLWGGDKALDLTKPGIYVFEVINIDEMGTPFIWLVAKTERNIQTGVVLYVDSTDADYSTEQINSEIATRNECSWRKPFLYLQNAINAAKAGDVIFMKAGVYYPTHLRTRSANYVDGDRLDRNATFTIKSEVDIYGGFTGEAHVWERAIDDEGMMVNKTVLSGDIAREVTLNSNMIIGDQSIVDSKENAAFNVVYFSSQKYTYINGVTISFGNANNNTGVASQGGGIRPSNNFLVLVSCEINNCLARAHGGAAHKGTLIGCKIYNNTVTGTGSSQGGAGAYESVLIGTQIKNNRASHGGGCRECKVYNSLVYNNAHGSNGAVYLGEAYNSIVFNNECSGETGAAVMQASLFGCTVMSNRSNYAFSFGKNFSNRISLVNTLFIRNRKLSDSTVSVGPMTEAMRKIDFFNNAYDNSGHPTFTVSQESIVDLSSCIQNLGLQASGVLPSTTIGNVAGDAMVRLENYVKNITKNLSPKESSLLVGKGVDESIDKLSLDYRAALRFTPTTIGALERRDYSLKDKANEDI